MVISGPLLSSSVLALRQIKGKKGSIVLDWCVQVVRERERVGVDKEIWSEAEKEKGYNSG